MSFLGQKTLWEKEKILITSIFSWLQVFSAFLTMLSKLQSTRVIKTQDCVVWGYYTMATSILSFSHNLFYGMKDKFNVSSNISFVIC